MIKLHRSTFVSYLVAVIAVIALTFLTDWIPYTLNESTVLPKPWAQALKTRAAWMAYSI